jgi:hypothetical protein
VRWDPEDRCLCPTPARFVRLRDKLDGAQLTAESMSVVEEVMHPSAITVWLAGQTVE